MTLASTLSGMREELRRPDTSAADKLVRIAQRGLWSAGLSPRLSALRCKIVEVKQAPKVMRGLSDLVIRHAHERDIPAMCSVAGGDPSLFRRRLASGDLGFVGELDGEILCYTWFHRGPKAFDEERLIFAPWGLDASSFWSYDAMSRVEARSSGIFVKVFQLALREIFEVHHAERVQGFIYHTNDASLTVHERLGFAVLGELTAVAVPGVKWLYWEGAESKRQWLLRRRSDFALRFPPV
jgi:hypothetical protein